MEERELIGSFFLVRDLREFLGFVFGGDIEFAFTFEND